MTNDRQKNRLVELLDEFVAKSNNTTTLALADHILADGWMRPPCKVGDKVYIIAEVSGKIIECSVIGAWMCEGNCTVITDCGTIYNLSYDTTVFLSREEAKAKLKEGVQG